MSLRQARGQRDASVISSSDMARIKRYSMFKERDTGVDPLNASLSLKHQKTLQVTETWGNSIANNRLARLNRLQQLKEEHERELQEIDAREKAVQKEARKKALEEAEAKRFAEKPEIRAVHAQLLLHEVQKEREMQIALKEKRKAMLKEQEEREVQAERESLRQAEEKEREIARKRREQNIRVAEEFKRQRDEAAQRKLLEKQEEVEDERELAREAQRQLQEEARIEAHRRAIARQNVEDIVRGNETILQFRERQRRIEQLEDERIKQQSIALQDEQERRAAAEKAMRQQKQAAIDALIQKGQEIYETQKQEQRTFEDLQFELQFQKDRKEIESIQAKQERLRQERHKEYLDAQAKIDAKKRQKKPKKTFPLDERIIEQEDASYTLERKKLDHLKEIAAFQQQQIREKKEREAADREREKLEFNREIELEEQKTREVQEYATQTLRSIRHI